MANNLLDEQEEAQEVLAELVRAGINDLIEDYTVAKSFGDFEIDVS